MQLSLPPIQFEKHIGSIPGVAPVRGTIACLKKLDYLMEARRERAVIDFDDRLGYCIIVFGVIDAIDRLRTGTIAANTHIVDDDYLASADSTGGEPHEEKVNQRVYEVVGRWAFYYSEFVSHDSLYLEGVIQTLDCARCFLAEATTLTDSRVPMEAAAVRDMSHRASRVIGLLHKASVIHNRYQHKSEATGISPFDDISTDLVMISGLVVAVHYWTFARLQEMAIESVEKDPRSPNHMSYDHAMDCMRVAYFLFMGRESARNVHPGGGDLQIRFPDSTSVCDISALYKKDPIDSTDPVPEGTTPFASQHVWVFQVFCGWLKFVSRHAIRMANGTTIAIAALNCYGCNGGIIEEHDVRMQAAASIGSEDSSDYTTIVNTAINRIREYKRQGGIDEFTDRYMQNGVPYNTPQRTRRGETFHPPVYFIPSN